MFVFFTSPVWPALNTTTVQYGGYKLPFCNSQFLCCFIFPNTPPQSFIKHRFMLFIKRFATFRVYLWCESTNVELLILVLNLRCGKFITSAASGLLIHVTLFKVERGCLYWKLLGKVNYFSYSVKLSWSTNFWGGWFVIRFGPWRRPRALI